MARLFRAALASLLVAASAFGSAQITPVDLTTEMRHNPVGIDVRQPRFGWLLSPVNKNSRGLMQSAYRILVASSAEKLTQNQADVWDSGRVAASVFWQLSYGGPELLPHTTYFWKTQVWDGEESPSGWSEPAAFTTGLLTPGNWTAHWIAAAPDSGPSQPALEGRGTVFETPPPPLPIFRRDFRLAGKVRQALLYVSGLGQYEVRINGSGVTNTVLNPGWSDYRTTVLYDAYDVRALLKPGDNAFGVLLGNGMYNVEGVKGRYRKFIGSFGQPKLILQLEVVYEDGSEARFVSDASWQTHPGPITFSSTYGGEDFDATMEEPGWDRAGFNALGWQSAVPVDGPGGTLTAGASAPIVAAETVTPVRISTPSPGITIYDLGRNMSGWPRIRVSGVAGSGVQILPGELLDDHGRVTQRSADAGPEKAVLFRYTLRGDPHGETWHPRFSYYGFRYLEISATPGTHLISVSGDFVHADVATVGRFESSSTLFNQIHALIDRAVLSNLVSVVTDCPTREKLGWLEQTYLNAATLMFNYDVSHIYEKMARDMEDAQAPNGLIPSIAPEYVSFVNAEGKSTAFRDSPEWGSAIVLSPWALYQFTGDAAILRGAYPAMRRYVAYLGSRADDHILSFGLGDWYDIGPANPGESQLTSKSVTATATYYQDLVVLSRVASLLGHPDDAAGYTEEARYVRDAFNSKLFDISRHYYDRGSQTAQAMPLALGMVPEGEVQPVLDRLIADIKAHNNHVTAGDIGFHYVVRALTDAGRSDVLSAMLSRTDAPSYGFQVAKGATTLTEAWDTNPNGSQNHFMLGHGEEWFYRGLAGISVDMSLGPGQAIQFRPSPVAGIASASAQYRTPMGIVSSSWRRTKSGQVTFDILIPAGAKAALYLPLGGAKSRMTLGSGVYQFSSPPVP